ncbi:Asp23/Gls24 family envelope stress response protein [Salisediminibacterium halotolerans]|uniref:Uncharacterized conserved protein YloU, alkaline shock protein (Asp23) family n=1 Tax=Salisediminibacterium halotolerans TaxID=517425 RepID=A0A1H9PGY5_9BACI|nr:MULTISPECIES: Asp23/Gls24 family envelope stress response protein [Salisediminibacterium]RLJ78077.1 putative alkaline shock family protein YloU [Actinophytocola xinjiangensis]RPE88585.1 putative alkaline shock family protein YloU [Salisediminibacterium halotolerans]TWG37054.1 putative alkaline shock family protein YloU [Salisediminibacterium halotolerans]SER47119.1 Uncharacterized conserved protein YloU, alkaline shock protein (Asp23) family [Salisediminibacterium haloalkalitolerans]GEL0690
MTENHLIQIAQNKEQLGDVEISPEVIEVIAGIAATEIEGVASLRGNFASGVAERLGRKASHGKGVKVEFTEEGVTLELFVDTNYGVSIPEVCKKMQENVFQTLKNMTAINVLSVDVHVVGVQFESAKPEHEGSQKKEAQ